MVTQRANLLANLTLAKIILSYKLLIVEKQERTNEIFFSESILEEPKNSFTFCRLLRT